MSGQGVKLLSAQALADRYTCANLCNKIRDAVDEERHAEAELMTAELLGRLGTWRIIDPTREGLLSAAHFGADIA